MICSYDRDQSLDFKPIDDISPLNCCGFNIWYLIYILDEYMFGYFMGSKLSYDTFDRESS